MKSFFVAILAIVLCSLRLCGTEKHITLFKRDAQSDGTNSQTGTTNDADNADNVTSGSNVNAGPATTTPPSTDKATTNGNPAHGGDQAAASTDKPTDLPIGVSNAEIGNVSSCGSLGDGRLSSHCLNASATVEQLLMPVATISNGSANANPGDIASTLLPTIQTYCSSTCIGPILDYYECNQNMTMIDLINGFICGEFHNQLCPIVVASTSDITENSTSSCEPSAATACPKDCNSTLSTVSNFLGCCASGAAQLGIVGNPELYMKCGIELSEPCTTNTTTAPSAGEGLHQTAIAVSLITVLSGFVMSWLF